MSDALLRSAERLELVGPEAATVGGAKTGPPERVTPSPDATAALLAGKQAFDELRFEDAVRDLRLGIEGLLSDPATCDFEVLLETQKQLAIAFLRMGEERKARATLDELVRLAPGYELGAGYPPAFEREIEKAKRRLEAQPRGAVAVEGPPGSTVYLDGRDLGMVPVLEEGVPVGLHFVRVDGTDGARFGQLVDIRDGLVTVTARLRGGAATVAPSGVAVRDLIDAATLEQLLAIAQRAGADALLAGAVSPAGERQLVLVAGLVSVRHGAVMSLTPRIVRAPFNESVGEISALVDEVSIKLSTFGAPAPLPLSLRGPLPTVVGPGHGGPRTADSALSPPGGPSGRWSTQVASGAQPGIEGLTPRVRVLERASTLADDLRPGAGVTEGAAEDPRPAVQQGSSWVWAVAAAGLAGLAVGGYFGYTALTRPVTGVISATW